MTSAEEAFAFLDGLVNRERQRDFSAARLDLAPVRRLLAGLGDPHAELSVLHIAGSKGKGSTALLAEALLRESGERVGTFTSPHLERWTERFRVDGREADGASLAAAVERLRPHVEALRAEDPAHAPSFFDATTAAALLLFRDARVDRAILEVGLGGRLDSTNAVRPAVTCVTTIELEHTEKLGTTLAAIAGEKAGIVKPGAPVVTGDLPAPAAEVVAERARAAGVPVSALGRDFQVEVLAEDLDGLAFRVRDGAFEISARLTLMGVEQAANAAVALACVRRLPGAPDDERLREAAARAFVAVRLPGRIEVLGRAPWRIADGAHTAASARSLARVLSRVPRGRGRLVLSISAGKDLAAILAAVLPGFDEVYVTRAEAIRSLEPAEVAAAVRAAAPHARVHAVPNPYLALRAAREGLGEKDLVCATGSMYLAGIARRVLA